MLWSHQPAMHILWMKDVCRWAGQNNVTLLKGFGCSQCACADPIVLHYANSSQVELHGSHFQLIVGWKLMETIKNIYIYIYTCKYKYLYIHNTKGKPFHFGLPPFFSPLRSVNHPAAVLHCQLHPLGFLSLGLRLISTSFTQIWSNSIGKQLVKIRTIPVWVHMSCWLIPLDHQWAQIVAIAHYVQRKIHCCGTFAVDSTSKQVQNGTLRIWNDLAVLQLQLMGTQWKEYVKQHFGYMQTNVLDISRNATVKPMSFFHQDTGTAGAPVRQPPLAPSLQVQVVFLTKKGTCLSVATSCNFLLIVTSVVILDSPLIWHWILHQSAMINFVIFVLSWYPGLRFEPSQVFKVTSTIKDNRLWSHLNTSLHCPYIPYISMLTWSQHSTNQIAGTCTWSLIFILRIHLFAGETCGVLQSWGCMRLKNYIKRTTYWTLWIRKSILAPCTHVIPQILVNGCSFSSTSNCLLQAWECWAAVPCSLAFCTWHFTLDEWKCWHSATFQAKPESILPIQTQPSSICTFPRPVQSQRNHVWSFGKICSMYIYKNKDPIITWIAPYWLPGSSSGAPVLDGDRSCGLWAPLAQQVSNKTPQEVLSENEDQRITL